MFDQLKQLKDLKNQAQQLQKILGEIVVEETALDNQLKLTANGNQKVLSLEISPELLSTEHKEKLENELKNLFNSVKDSAQKQAAQKMQQAGNFPGLN